MAEDAPFLPGLSPVMGKPVHLAFDGGRLTSDAGVLMLAEIERPPSSPSAWQAALRTREPRGESGTGSPR